MQEKDRAKFGPEYGDRFCMLQLVGRHEMEKVTLQRESDAANHKLMVRGHDSSAQHAVFDQRHMHYYCGCLG